MKKVYGLLFILTVLSLLDGTPIHNHHGKFISSRNKTSINLAFTISGGLLDAEQNAITDETNDDDNIIGTPGMANRLLSFNVPLTLTVSPDSATRHPLTVPLYTLGCDFRI